MKNNYYLSDLTHSPIQNKNSAIWRLHLTMLFSLFFILVGYAQKGKGGGGNKDVILFTCIQVLENGLIQAQFGYTNPTNKDITVGEDESVVFVSDKDDDDEINGIRKEVLEVTTFEKNTTNENAFSVTFNSSGHAKWTVTFGNNETKIRATAASTVCVEPCVVCPVFGGAGKAFGPLWPDALALATGNAGEEPSDLIFQINEQEEVLVEIVPRFGYMQQVLDLLINTFGRQPADFIVDPATVLSKGYATIDVYFPISELLKWNDYGDDDDLSTPYILNFGRASHPPFLQVGAVDSQGDGAMLSNIVRESFVIRDEFGTPFSVIGSGVKVGIISDSWDKAAPGQAATDVANGDLPGLGNPNGFITEVEIEPKFKDFPGVGTDEGRAMGQIISDVATGAALGFSTGVLSSRDMALAIDNFAEAGYNVVTDDVVYPLGPFYEDGEIAQALGRFTDAGGTYVTAAGNFADNAYVSPFSNSGNSVVLPDFLPPGTTAHVFGIEDGAPDITQPITLDIGIYYLVLQWDEPQASLGDAAGADIDLDIYILNNSNEVQVNTNWENLEGDALEAVIFESLIDDAPANIMITSANGPVTGPLNFSYIIFKANGLEVMKYKQIGAPTVSGQGMSTKAITVGAVNYTEVPLPLDESVPIEPRVFSSYAGDRGDGTILIDILGPDGVDVNLPFFGKDTDGSGFNNFSGTSAAAPHVAGAIALALSTGLPEGPSWYPGGLPIDALQLFQDNTTPVNGSVDQVGSGLINVEKAFKQIAAQTAILISLTAGEGELSVDDVEVTINGKYFTEASGDLDPLTVYFGEGEGRIELEIDETTRTDTELVVSVPPFVGNPNLVVNTEPNTTFSPTGAGGGASNSIPIFDDGTIVLKIIAEDLPGDEEGVVPIEYGDSYTYEYSVEGLPEGVIIGEDLPAIILTSQADDFDFPNVNTYVIFPEFDEDNATLAQRTALAGYKVNKETGLLRITQKELTITPESEDIPTYGDAIVLGLNYEYDDTNIADDKKDDFRDWIRDNHADDFFLEINTLALINRFNAVVNGEDVDLDAVLGELMGGSWMATENTLSLVNRFNAVVNEMDLVNLDIEDFTTFNNRFNAVVNTDTDPALNRFNAVVNGEGLLNGAVGINDNFNAVVNGSGLGDDENDFSKVFAILNADDEPAPADVTTLIQFYALNLITGLDVTGIEQWQVPFHNSYPGAFLDPIAANFIITYESSTFEVLNPAELIVTITPGDLIIDQGEAIDTSLISANIEGYVYNQTQEDVFPEGIPYLIEDANGVAYTPGATGVYFIKIMEPQSYMISEELSQFGVLYVNPTGDHLRKIRTYLDCVEEDFTEGTLDYIAHYRYENPNDETIYIAVGPENQLTGPASLTAIGELPFIFLPGQGTFQIRFDGSDGKILKWELTSRESTNKSATTLNASASSNKCGSGNEIGDSSFEISPNPTSGFVTIVQRFEGVVTLDVFDYYGFLYLSIPLDGRNGPIVHEDIIDMSAYPKGMYFFRFSTNNDVQAYTVIKADE